MSCSYNKHYRNDEHRVGPIVRLWRMFCVSKERVFVWVEVRSWEEGTGDAVLRMYMKGTRWFQLEEIAPWWSFYSSFISVLVSIGVVTKYPSERLRQWRSILFWLWMLEDLGTRQVGCCFQLSDGNNFLLCSCDRERNLCPYFFYYFCFIWMSRYIYWPQRASDPPGTGVTDGWEPPWKGREPTLHPLQDLPVLWVPLSTPSNPPLFL